MKNLIQECKTIKQYLELKYINPSYGGEKRQEYKNVRKDNDYNDYFNAWFRCSVTSKLYWLTVTDVEVTVQSQATVSETFHIEITVSNIPDGAHIHRILGACVSPFEGSQPTEYSSVECAYSVDLRAFDNYVLALPKQ